MAPRQIVILRHAERPSDPRDPDLSPAGEDRAEMLRTLIPERFPNPQHLFAAAPSKNSNRPVETLAPLAVTTGLKLNESVADQDYEVLAQDLLTKPKYEGKLVIICWHHGHIPDLAMALRVPAAEIDNASGMIGRHWDPLVFDRFWSLEFAGNTPTLTISEQSAQGGGAGQGVNANPA